MAKYTVEGSVLTGIADAIREKTGSNSSIKVKDMENEIRGISSGGSAVETCTITVALSKTTTLPAGFCIYYTALSDGEMKTSLGMGYTTHTYVQAGTLAVFDCVKNTIISISAPAEKLKFTIPDGYDYRDSKMATATGLSAYSAAIAPNADGEIVITYG